MNTKSELRRSLNARRRALSRETREQAAIDVAHHVSRTRWLAPGRRIGLYSSMPHELGTSPLIELARRRGCEVYVPRIVSMRSRLMRFVPFGTPGRRHELGMHEPASTEYFPARFLDTIFVPAIALDGRGARLGFGAGFYDRTLAFRRVRHHWRGPRLVGMGYAFQVVAAVPVTATDVFMDVLVTEKGIYELLADEDRAVDVRHR